MKRRTLTLTLCILACIALIGVGFASWVITYNKEDEVTGNVSIDTVDDKSHIVTITNKTSEQTVRFAALASTNTSDWFKGENKGDTDKESLVLTYQVSVTNYESLADGTGAISVTLVEDGTSVYSAAVTDGLVGALPSTENAGISISGSNGTYTITITFKWGEYFDESNPTTFYNSKTAEAERSDAKSKDNKTYLEDAIYVLGGDTYKTYVNLATAKFKITVTPVVKTTTSE